MNENKTVFKRVGSLRDVKVGDEVEIIESHEKHLLTVRGEVTHADGGGVVVGLEGPTVLYTDAARNALHVNVKVEPPPTEWGSVVKYYAPSFLWTRAAYLNSDGQWWDTANGYVVNLDRTEWTVIYDAGQR